MELREMRLPSAEAVLIAATVAAVFLLLAQVAIAHENTSALAAVETRSTDSSSSAKGEQGFFLPHGICILWDKSLLLLHIVSDSIIALSYYSIPLALIVIVRKRRDLAFSWMFVLFAAFIVACGTTHIMDIWTIWNPAYWVDGIIKSVTAAISVVTAILVWPLIPKLLVLPSPAQLEAANRDLQREIAERTRTEAVLLERSEDLMRSNADLERFNKLAVGREQRMIGLKREVNALLEKTGQPAAYDLTAIDQVGSENGQGKEHETAP